MNIYTDLNTSERILLGPGPSIVHPRVLRAMAQPLVGHLDPQFLNVMTEVQSLLRYVFQTDNDLTIPVSGTGSAAMEAAICNFIEPGDEIIIGGERLFWRAIVRHGRAVRGHHPAGGETLGPGVYHRRN